MEMTVERESEMAEQQIEDARHEQIVALERKIRNGGLTLVEALNLEWLYDEGGY